MRTARSRSLPAPERLALAGIRTRGGRRRLLLRLDLTRPLADQPGWQRTQDLATPRGLCDTTLLAAGDGPDQHARVAVVRVVVDSLGVPPVARMLRLAVPTG